MPNRTAIDLTRRSFLRGALATAALLPLGGLLAGCSSDQGASDEPEGEPLQENAAATPASTILVAYYSAQGHTQRVAESIADALGADTFVITPADPYTTDDLDYNDESSRVVAEHEDPDRHTELETVTPDGFDGYEAVFVGYPIWWGDAAWVVDDFVSQNDFSGKTVIPFCTSASSPLGESGELLARMAGTGDWQEGMRFRSSATADEVDEWLSDLDL